MLIPYLVIINAVGFLLMLIDKRKAVKGKWRIPENVLFGVAFLGGSVGILLGMYTFRHKTKHTTFTVGIPVLMFLHFGLLVWLFK